MSPLNRRDLLASLAALAVAPAAESQPTPTEPVLGAPRVFLHEDLPVKKNPNGSESRQVINGTFLTGEYVSIHESTIPVGATPNPPHQHRPSDILLVREGTLAFEHDGKAEKVGPGGVILATSMTSHTVRNIGDVPARYFVIGVSHEAAKQLA
jgi:mannose-6-phosphate isomerase-like protein (cupin superfamily)